MKFRSIAVEGPIGVGKTSFVELLARKFDAHRSSRTSRIRSSEVLRGQAGRRVPGPAVLPALALSPAAGAVAARPVPPDHLARLHLPQGQDLRLPQPRRQRAADLRQALRDARGAGAQARPGDLPAGRDEDARRADPGRNRTTSRRSPRPTSTKSTRPTTTSSSTTRRRHCWSSTRPRSTSCTTRSTWTSSSSRSTRWSTAFSTTAPWAHRRVEGGVRANNPT